MKQPFRSHLLDLNLSRRTGLALLGASVLLAACDKAGGARFKSLDISGGNYAKDFSLPDMNGKVRTMADFRGKAVAMFFGYTHCPDVCPTTLTEMVQVKQLLGADGDKLQVIFVTVDPERDKPEMLRQYMAAFDPTFLALVPTPEQLRKEVAPGFRVYYNKVPTKDSDYYSMDHSAGVLLFDKSGKVRLHSKYGSKAQDMADDIRLLLKE